jgi:hypothetical protein
MCLIRKGSPGPVEAYGAMCQLINLPCNKQCILPKRLRGRASRHCASFPTKTFGELAPSTLLLSAFMVEWQP